MERSLGHCWISFTVLAERMSPKDFGDSLTRAVPKIWIFRVDSESTLQAEALTQRGEGSTSVY